LKIGDPFVFGRGGEEVLTFREFGVEPKVIPVSLSQQSKYFACRIWNDVKLIFSTCLQGVSAAFSAPLLGSIPVTHRGVSNQVVMCTGYGRNGTSPDLIQYHKEQTIVFLMAVGRLRELCQRLIDMAGYPSKTPVAIIQDAGCPTQRTVVGDMETIADLAEEYQVKPPSTIIVGEVVRVLLEDNSETKEQVVGLVQNMTAAEV
jgi:uroporphyrin-III C-methyltransferase